jgi:hypothetical protein
MSRYYTLYDSNDVSKTQTIATTTATSTSSVLSSRRISISSSLVPHYVSFAATPTIVTTSSFVIPANTILEFNFTSGYKVAVQAVSGNGVISIVDAD